MGWRDHLPVHPAADLFPLMSESELRELGENIRANSGLLSPVTLYRGKLLDGRNRLDAMELVGITLDWSDVTLLGGIVLLLDNSINPYDYVVAANLHRRHLTGEQKRELIAKVLKAKPKASNRQIAKQVKADHKTVAAVRSEKEATGEIPQLEKTVGGDGKQRKSRATKKPKPAPQPGTQEYERDRKECVALDLKVKEAERKLAQRQSAEVSIEQRRAENARLDADRGDIEPELTMQERWHNSLGMMAGEAISLEAYWTKEFGQWENFEVPSDLVTLVNQAAEAWCKLLGKISGTTVAIAQSRIQQKGK